LLVQNPVFYIHTPIFLFTHLSIPLKIFSTLTLSLVSPLLSFLTNSSNPNIYKNPRYSNPYSPSSFFFILSKKIHISIFFQIFTSHITLLLRTMIFNSGAHTHSSISLTTRTSIIFLILSNLHTHGYHFH